LSERSILDRRGVVACDGRARRTAPRWLLSVEGGAPSVDSHRRVWPLDARRARRV